MQWVLLATMGLNGALAPEPASAASSLERELIRQGPQIVKLLNARGYRNVGVLKFLVTKDQRSFSDNVGTLNLLLARRLELALILRNNPRAPLGIIEDASAVAEKLAGASYLTPEGRQKLFGARYHLAWGRDRVQPDAFLTGTVGVSKDLRTLTIGLLVFDQKSNRLEPLLADFTAPNEPQKLSEMGESFASRGADIEALEAIGQAEQVSLKKAPHPAVDDRAPMTLEVRYNDRAVPLEMRDGKAHVREPRENENVSLVLRRGASRERLAAVLKVNGTNTLYKQTAPDLYCNRWIFDPEDQQITIRGFQIDPTSLEKFRVLSVDQSKGREMYYGADVGTITLTVFRERKEQLPPDLTDEQAEAVVVKRAKLPEKKSESFHALKASLLDEANRGLITEGEPISGEIRRVKFDPDPVPMMVLTVIYYTPGG